MVNWTASAMTRALIISLLPSNERTAEITIFASKGLTWARLDFGRPALIFDVMTFCRDPSGLLLLPSADGRVRTL
jgi:hypothetical protein